MLRTHNCNELDAAAIGKEVELCGWVHRRRDHGGLIFIDLRDRYGVTQVVADPAESKECHKNADVVRPEYVIRIKGVVRSRPEGMANPTMKTGEIEVLINEFEVLNKAKTPPFEIDQETDVGEETRLKYRYLDLRRERMQKNVEMRYRIIKEIRVFLDKEDFLEIETPIMIKGTPEGSREYLVPSRMYPGTFYVLPQSPQQLKQMLMVAGMDKYFQIARCFRDEDLRGDRQPEFTQLDLEMSFVEQEDVMELNERLLIHLIEKLLPEKKIMEKPFRRLTWQQAMDDYGSDKPDLRFEMKIVDLSEELKDCGFQVFSGAVKDGGFVRALKVEGGATYTRKQIDDFTDLAKTFGAKGLAYIQMTKDGPKAPILKFLSEENIKAIVDKTGAKTGDIVFFGADKHEVVCDALGQIRLACADLLNLRDPKLMVCCWVYDFPLFEWSKEEQQIQAVHHPFTRPKAEDLDKLESEPESVRAIAYDVVLNGSEIGGGSIRIHEADLQAKIFDILKISKDEAERRFGHILNAFQYGAPPHGGVAWGLDRLVMLFQDEPNIREVIPFPKDQKAKDVMLGAPSVMPPEQVAEAHIRIEMPE